MPWLSQTTLPVCSTITLVLMVAVLYCASALQGRGGCWLDSLVVQNHVRPPDLLEREPDVLDIPEVGVVPCEVGVVPDLGGV